MINKVKVIDKKPKKKMQIIEWNIFMCISKKGFTGRKHERLLQLNHYMGKQLTKKDQNIWTRSRENKPKNH